MRSITGLIRTVRPQQWVKNVFVAAPLVFARDLTDTSQVAKTAIAVLAFCLLSGAVYAFNDVRDIDADRVHPKKRFRPIAAGDLSERTAMLWAGVLAAFALSACFILSWKLALIAAAYLVQNIAYSVRLKHIAFVDVGVIANFFFMIVLGGCSSIFLSSSACVVFLRVVF